MLMRRWAIVPLLAVLALATSGCDLFPRLLGVPTDCQPEDIPNLAFGSSERIFRGTWTGVLVDWPNEGDSQDVTMEVQATYVDDSGYTVEGTFQLGTDPALDLTGEVTGGCFQQYDPAAADSIESASLPTRSSLDADVRDVDTLVWRLDADVTFFTPDDQDRATVEILAERLDASGDAVFSDTFLATRTNLP